jgi:GrpB-like predicted nucleotidyltransferase (UPF0157 family)
VTSGAEEPLGGPVQLSDYDPRWPLQFEAESKRIRDALREAAIAIDHTGSTSVPGLAAKPIIDMLLTVKDSTDESTYAPTLEALGYRLVVREPGWFQHRMFKLQDPAVNLHVFSVGCEEIGRVLKFRDWLRENAADRELYQCTKRALALKEWRQMQDYADAKTDVIKAILNRALKA